MCFCVNFYCIWKRIQTKKHFSKVFHVWKLILSFIGDIVANKKPFPDIYLLAIQKLNLNPKRCWVIEDSRIGLQAAKRAQLNCLITKSYYTINDNFNESNIIVNDLDNGLDGLINITYLNYQLSKIIKKEILNNQNNNENMNKSIDMFAIEPNLSEMFNKIMKGETGNKGLPF